MGYKEIFDSLGLRQWCGDVATKKEILSLDQLLAKAKGEQVPDRAWWDIPFPSLDNLHEACNTIPRTRDMVKGIENGFLYIKDYLKIVLDPLTQPLSWILDGSLYVLVNTPWWILIPLFLLLVQYISKSIKLSLFVLTVFVFLAFIDHYSFAIQTLSVIFVCTMLSVIFGIPIGILMSKSDRVQASAIPILDMLQTLPTFVYLIPLIFLFSVTESKLYGIAIILYAIVPVIRLTDLGIRLVDKDVLEAANAFGMKPSQKLVRVEIPLALPNIMAGINQTIMMALAMVVIASLVSAPGLGVLVLRGIRNLELGVGLVSGFCIVLIAVLLDRVSKAALKQINTSSQ